MAWWMAIPAVASLAQGALASEANEDALGAQQAAGQQQLALQRGAMVSGIRQNYPIYRGQINALNRLYDMQDLPNIKAMRKRQITQPIKNALDIF